MKNTIIATLITYILVTSENLWSVKIGPTETFCIWLIVMIITWSLAVYGGQVLCKRRKHHCS